MTTAASGDELLVLTIGQAPREDLQEELRDVLGAGWPIRVLGALDGMSLDEIQRLTPHEDADALHTHLPSGHDVVISKVEVTKRLHQLLVDAPSGPVIVACTGTFVGLPERPALMYPSAVVRNLIDALLPAGRLGVLVPLQEQVASFEASWTTTTRTPTVVSVTPGTSPDAAIEVLRDAEVDLVVLDCFGYSSELLDAIRRGTGRPVLSAVRSCALIAKELMS